MPDRKVVICLDNNHSLAVKSQVDHRQEPAMSFTADGSVLVMKFFRSDYFVDFSLYQTEQKMPNRSQI